MMANNPKYAGLPDLDIAPEFYETPELTDDASESRTTYENDDSEALDIDRQRLDPDEARTHFQSARVDARDVNFSDTIEGRRKSYRVSTRRKRRGGDDEAGEVMEEEDDGSESLRRKFARLRREWEEVQAEVDRRKTLEDKTLNAREGGLEEEYQKLLAELSNAMGALQGSEEPPHNGHAGSAVDRLEQQMGKQTKPATGRRTEVKTAQEDSGDGSLRTTNQQNSNLSKIATFDTRLTHLENLLGISTLPLPSQSSENTKPLIPTLSNLDRQITTLSSASATSLDAMSTHIRTLTASAEKLAETRASSQAAPESSSPETFPNTGTSTEDSKQDAKINALYGTLPTIESLAPLLPSVLDRLRSLRLIHADAAGASQSLAAVEKRQAEMGEEIRSWREGLEKVEEVVRSGEVRMKGNMGVVETWVKELEGRMKALGGN